MIQSINWGQGILMDEHIWDNVNVGNQIMNGNPRPFVRQLETSPSKIIKSENVCFTNRWIGRGNHKLCQIRSPELRMFHELIRNRLNG